MGYMCDFCGEQRSMVYCRSDSACLCLSCDRNIHSANTLSQRHTRTLLCDICNLQPAYIRCIEEKKSLCENCDWVDHCSSNSISTHKRQTINCYSGCPSSAELSKIWSFILDFPSMDDSTSEKALDSVSITDSNSKKLEGRLQNVDQEMGLANSTLSKMCIPGTRVSSLREDARSHEDFNMYETDLDIENYEELFGVAPDTPEDFFSSEGIDRLFGGKDISGSNLNSRGIPCIAEGLSLGLVNAKPTCSNAGSADSIMNSKTDPNFCSAMIANTSLSYSGLAGENNAADYQDCGTSSMLFMGDTPWGPSRLSSSLPSSTRSDAVQRYMEKKKSRKFEKKVRYASRKARADVRKRVKGRFVKAGDAYDYDPLSQTRSF